MRTARQGKIGLEALEFIVAPTRGNVTSTELHQGLNIIDEFIIARIVRARVVVRNNSRNARSLTQDTKLLVAQLALISARGVDGIHVATSCSTIHMRRMRVPTAARVDFTDLIKLTPRSHYNLLSETATEIRMRTSFVKQSWQHVPAVFIKWKVHRRASWTANVWRPFDTVFISADFPSVITAMSDQVCQPRKCLALVAHARGTQSLSFRNKLCIQGVDEVRRHSTVEEPHIVESALKVVHIAMATCCCQDRPRANGNDVIQAWDSKPRQPCVAR